MSPALKNELPEFDRFSLATHQQTVLQLIQQANRAKAAAYTQTATWENFYWPLESAIEALSRAWGLMTHLNAVNDSEPMRAAYESLLGPVTQFFTDISLDQRLFEQYQALELHLNEIQADPIRRHIVKKTLLDFRLGGAQLLGPDRERFAQIQERLAQLSQAFSKNVLDATNAFTEHVTDPTILEGLPQDVIAAAAAQAKTSQVDGWVLTLRMPCYLPVQQYAQNRGLRERFYRAYVTRASEFGAPELNNQPLISEILALRQEQAALLGFVDFAALSLETKMASSSQEVETFLSQLAQKARPYAEADLEQLRQFSEMADLAPWDIPFYSEKLKEQRYAFSELEAKQYFQANRVLHGLFQLIERLFGANISPEESSVWDPAVTVFKVERRGRLIGQFYVDLYARANKRGGAWMDSVCGRKQQGPSLQTPVAYLVCNFMPPAAGKPGLLTHDEVITLFHEMGHGLHHLLTQVDELAVSGINGVEWDAVELPSQFMENFCWDYEVIAQLSAHIETQAVLPKDLFAKMLKAKHFQSGLQTVRQLEFGLFDMAIHAQPTPTSIQEVLDGIRQAVAVIRPPSFNRFQTSFSHIFAGGYAAGYYSYKWAEVLSADCFEAFEEAKADPAKTGQRFLDEILSRGGSRPAIASFESFRGRAPQLEALLRHNGLKESL
jgi:oligopeptidase A